MEALHIIVYVSSEIWDEFLITAHSFISGTDIDNCIFESDYSLSVETLKSESVGDNARHSCCCILNVKSCFVQDGCFFHRVKAWRNRERSLLFKQCIKMQMTGYLVSVFIQCLKLSEYYRSTVISHLLTYRNFPHKSSECYPCKLVVQLTPPKKDIIDHKWNDRLVTLALERCELDHAMSWLSTLGGAFSALGDHLDHCALVAGRISVQQLKLALRLGDPVTVARCKLYFALSLLQRGYLKEARSIIEEQYLFAISQSIKDTRLVRMCQGIWAKLKYQYHLKKFKRKTPS